MPAAGAATALDYDHMTFRDHLASQYVSLANKEHHENYDYKCAAHMNAKADLLKAGHMVGPDHPAQFNISDRYEADLIAAREELIYAIQNYSYPENRQALAIAQVKYDCWIDQAVDWPRDEDRITCDDSFYEALSEVNRIDPLFGEDLEFFI